MSQGLLTGWFVVGRRGHYSGSRARAAALPDHNLLPELQLAAALPDDNPLPELQPDALRVGRRATGSRRAGRAPAAKEAAVDVQVERARDGDTRVGEERVVVGRAEGGGEVVGDAAERAVKKTLDARRWVTRRQRHVSRPAVFLLGLAHMRAFAGRRAAGRGRTNKPPTAILYFLRSTI